MSVLQPIHGVSDRWLLLGDIVLDISPPPLKVALQRVRQEDPYAVDAAVWTVCLTYGYKISRLFMRMRPLRYIWDASTHLSCETFAPHDPATNWPAEPEHTDLARCTFRLMREETYTTTRALKYVADSPIRGGKHRSGSGGDGPTARAAFSYTLTSAATATGGPPGPDTTIAFIIAALNIPDLGDPRFYSFGSRGGSFDDNGGVFESGSNGSGNNGNGKRRRDETEHPYRPAPPGSL